MSNLVNSWRKEIIYISSLIESLIDFSDEDIPEELSNVFLRRLNKIENKIKNSVNSAKLSSFIKEGFSVTIIGKPNVGKSSLINALTKLNINLDGQLSKI